MTTPPTSIHRFTLVFAWGFAVLITVLSPTVYYLASLQYLRGLVDAQAELSAREVSGLVISNPTMWQFEQVRLSELLERKALQPVSEIRSIVDVKGEEIAHNHVKLSPPLITRQHDIYDSGTVMAHIQISRSIRPLLIEAFFVAVCAMGVSSLILYLILRFPLRTIQQAYQAITESEDKYRSLYSSMREGLALHSVEFDEHGALRTFVISDANPTFLAMLGGTSEELLGRDSLELFGETFREFLPELLRVLEDGSSLSFDYSLSDQGRTFSVQAFSPGPGRIATLFEEITERKKSEEQIQHMAYFDALTGLPNRSLMLDRLNRAIARSTRDQSTLAILFLDLDRFKAVNDTLGHSTGDMLLIEVSQRLRSFVRTSDTLARLGGDEFVVIVSDLDKEVNAAHIAQKLIDSLAAPFRISGHELHITTSIGVAIFPEDGVTAEVLIKNADMAMYAAKESGRNNYNYYSAEMNQKAHERLTMEESIRGALVRSEFFLEYQPIMDPVSGTISAAEALVRWNHPERGRVAPDMFIALAEDTGLIVPLGEWVLRSACSMITKLRDSGLPPIRIAVNVSSRQIDQQNFADVVTKVLQETGANPAQLEIELTESCLMRHSADNIAGIFELRGLGVSIAIDDFGTGYSSLGYIKTLPIDHIKVDRSFIIDVTTNPNDQAIVESIITMSQKLGIRNIAEGVETADQLAFLKSLGCDEIQGYYFHRPLAVAAFEELLRAQPETSHAVQG